MSKEAHRYLSEVRAVERERRLARVASECDLYGHDYQVRDREQSREEWSQARPRVPDRVVCPRCDKSWKVER